MGHPDQAFTINTDETRFNRFFIQVYHSYDVGEKTSFSMTFTFSLSFTTERTSGLACTGSIPVFEDAFGGFDVLRAENEQAVSV